MRKIVSACLKLVLAASFAVTMGLSTSSPATAFTGDQWQHIMDCAGWMFSDPARHAAECGPGHLGNITSDSKGYSFGGSPLAPPAPKPCATAFPSGSADQSLLLIQVVECCDSCECFTSCERISQDSA